MIVNNNTSNDYEQFLTQFPIQYYAKGSVLISPDEDPLCMYHLESGEVYKYDVTKYGEKIIMNVFQSPMLFPLSWVLNKTPNRHYFEARTRIAVRCMPTEQVDVFMRAHPEMAYDLLQKVYSGLENTQRRIVYLTRGSLRSRVIFELLIEARRSGETQSDGSTIITINEINLAERAGVSRETVSRELGKIFKSTDLCRRQGRSIIIRDIDGLDELLRTIT